MQLPHALLAALAAAPRRYRMPPLPVDAAAATALGGDTALVFAIEVARSGSLRGAPAPAGVPALFTRSLAQLIRTALAAQGGDPVFQALVLQAQEPAVAEFVQLTAQRAADDRAIRAATDAVAHPGKLRASSAAGPLCDALSRLHGLAASQAWAELEQAARQLLDEDTAQDARLRDALGAIVTHPALERLRRMEALQTQPAVRRLRALGEQRGPMAGSAAAAAQGRIAARVGDDAERATVQALQAVAHWLNGGAAGPGGYRVVRSLRPPAGFPGEAGKAKDEWDAAIVRTSSEGSAADIVLLAEVKASPAAATSDASRLHRGLLRLAHASADASYPFASADGRVFLTGASLRALRPQGRTLPPNVIYCCTAPPETQPQMLSAAAKAVLLAEPASLAFADQLTRGASPDPDALAPVWEALTTAPQLRSALHQYDTARAVREAMLHPDDLARAAQGRAASTPP
jgi:hypothetical protein